MNDITALTPEKLVEIRQRHTPIAAPKCHICGAEMTIGAMSASRIVYACSGATYDDAGCHYAPGRSIADDHYAQSRVTVVDVSDPDVLELVEALEKAQRQNGYLREQSAEWERKAISNFEECAEMSARIEELEAQRKLAFTAGNRWADKFREAEAKLESRTVTVKLPELHVGVVQSGHAVMVPYPAGHWFNKTAIFEMLDAAGIQVIEGEG